MKISFFTIGCKLNMAETEELKKDLVSRGFSVAPFATNEDVAIVRGCGVTCNASRTTREFIRRAKRKNIYTIAIGCVENKNLPEIDFVAKNNKKAFCHLVSLRGSLKATETIPMSNASNRGTASSFRCPSGLLAMTRKTRALVKIQDGCNFNCAYCIIPSFRGKSQSISPEKIIEQIKSAEKEGYKEVVLTGVNIGQYVAKIKRLNDFKIIKLEDLLKTILNQTEIPRIRLGSLDPRLIPKKLVQIYNNLTIYQFNNRLLPHWHLSLQSGSNTVLKKMNRGYTTEQYYKIVQALRKNNPLFSFTTDIIVGFPCETEEEFQETCDFVKKVGFAKVHVFPFSPRPGTKASLMNPKIQDIIIKRRVKKLMKIADKVGRDFIAHFEDVERPVLFEHKNRGKWEGYTPEYIRVLQNQTKNLKNKILNIKLSSTICKSA